MYTKPDYDLFMSETATWFADSAAIRRPHFVPVPDPVKIRAACFTAPPYGGEGGFGNNIMVRGEVEGAFFWYSGTYVLE
jgi:hypothetical protein